MDYYHSGGSSDQSSSSPSLSLPPGFRFHPTDEEVVTHYLTPKALDGRFACVVIADVNLNRCEPWELPGKAKMGEKEWFFFVHKDRKYPTGSRTNRATKSGYWKATGRDREIFRGRGGSEVLVGLKKTLVFYLGRAPHGTKTQWVMHEFRLDGQLPANLPPSAKDEWAVCRVFSKDMAAAAAAKAEPPQMEAAPAAPAMAMERSDSITDFLDGFLLDQLPPLMDLPLATGPMEDDGASFEVKAEQQENPSYFSLPATSTRVGGQAADSMASSSKLYLGLDDLDPLMDYSNNDFWKF